MAKSGPPKEKPKLITINEVKRTRRFIFIAYTKGDEDLTVRSHDNPLPSFLQALEGIAPLVSTILHTPKTYTESDFRVGSVEMDVLGGARTVSIKGQKSLSDAGKAFAVHTPPRLLEHPTEEGSYTPPLTKADVALVESLIEEAKQYVLGDRAQGQLPLDDEAEDDAGDTADDAPALPFAADTGTTGKPAKKQRAPAAAK